MKKNLILVFFPFSLAWAQGSADTLRYTQESGTLQKQRFIDRYDYVFMTKEPTKWMVKATIHPFQLALMPVNYYTINLLRQANTNPNWLNLEWKLTPSFSLQLGGSAKQRSTKLVSTQGQHKSELPFINFTNLDVINATLGEQVLPWVSLESRWYYNQAKRHKEGKSANNFSGNYMGVGIEKVLNPDFSQNETRLTTTGNLFDTKREFEQLSHRITLNYGMQRRFLRHGLIDFSFQLSNNYFQRIGNDIRFLDGNNTAVNPYDQTADFWKNVESSWSDLGVRSSWQFSTDLRIGLTMGDFKKTKKPSLCNLLLCERDIKQQWKIHWPQLSLSPTEQKGSLGIGYEFRVGNSAWSVNTELATQLLHGVYANVDYHLGPPFSPNSSTKTANLDIWLSSSALTLEPRFYLSQYRKVRKTGGVYNMSGAYVGAYATALVTQISERYSDSFSRQSIAPRIGFGPVIGFQQRLFQNGFVDLSFRPLWAGKGNNPVNNIFGLNLKLGFAF